MTNHERLMCICMAMFIKAETARNFDEFFLGIAHVPVRIVDAAVAAGGFLDTQDLYDTAKRAGGEYNPARLIAPGPSPEGGYTCH